MTSKKKPLSLKERIRRGQPTRTVPVWVGADMDLLDEYERLTETKPEPEQATSLAGPAEGAAVARDQADARLAELRDLLDDYRVDFVVRGLGEKRWRALVNEHKPRLDDDGSIRKEDRVVGANMDTFPGALIRAATASPAFDDEDWAALLGTAEEEGTLTDGQLGSLSAAAYTLSKVDVDVPFSSAASSTNRRSASA